MKSIPSIFILSLSLLIGCTESASIETADELVVSAYLEAEHPIRNFTLEKIIPIGSEETAETINDATVEILIDDQSFLLNAVGDSGRYVNDELIIEADKTYSLLVKTADKTLFAETYVPFKPTGLTISDENIQRAKIEDFSDIASIADGAEPIEINWDNDNNNYYLVAVENMEDNPEVINTLFDSEDSALTITNSPEISNVYFINSFQAITHFGTHRVVLYRVNPEYAVLYENGSSGQGTLTQIQTNIENGFGIFTGVNSDTLFFEVQKI